MNIKELRRKALKETKRRVAEKKFGKDKLVIQAVETIDELDEIVNLMNERVRHWYALHYPELEKLVKNTETYLAILTELKHRKEMTRKALEKYLRPDQAEKVERIAKESMGAEVSDEDLDAIAKYATLAVHARREREELADYVDKTIKEIAPNMYALAGGMLVARLMALAGSLERLAEFPASTIQLLGAEKALFAHIRKGVKPPKHGVIFQHPAVRGAPKKKRGKVARLLASKLSIAAKMDYFGHEDRGKELKKEFEEKLVEILKKK
ncbi:MAG: hypothetical protein J7K68_06510 [Candidatus Diapherotrites archaeon]|nr:hypothetical protein [Candidatus Diapherotrites archaeon]